MNPLSLEAIVVAYRSHDVIDACVSSLLADPGVARVHVVDNSPDWPLGLAAQERLSIHRPGINLGFGNGVNFAAPHVSSNFVAIVNPDTTTHKGTLDSCLAVFRERPEVALLSPRVFVADKLFRTSEHAPSLPRVLAHSVGLGSRLGVARRISDHKHTHETEALNGAFLVARRAALDAVGWFDTSIFLFGEETDLCHRLRQASFRILYLAEGRVDHVDGLSSERASVDLSELRRQARVEQLRRHRGTPSARAYAALLRLRGRRHASS